MPTDDNRVPMPTNDADPPVVSIASRPDGRGFRIHIRNASAAAIFATPPHPAKNVWLSQDGKGLFREAYPLIWDYQSPQKVAAGSELVADVSLISYWTELLGCFEVGCRLSFSRTEHGEESTCEATGEVDLRLPSRAELRVEAKEYLQTMKGKPIPDRPTVRIVEPESE